MQQSRNVGYSPSLIRCNTRILTKSFATAYYNWTPCTSRFCCRQLLHWNAVSLGKDKLHRHTSSSISLQKAAWVLLKGYSSLRIPYCVYAGLPNRGTAGTP